MLENMGFICSDLVLDTNYKKKRPSCLVIALMERFHLYSLERIYREKTTIPEPFLLIDLGV